MTEIVQYRYPDDADPEVAKVKRLASSAARLEGRMQSETNETRAKLWPKYLKIRSQLRTYISDLKWSRLFYWRDIILIDPRWCGASGTGAYIAVASRIVNETAAAILKENPAPTFWIEGCPLPALKNGVSTAKI